MGAPALGRRTCRHAPLEAQTLYHDALAQAEALGMIPLRAHCLLGRGRLRRRIGDDERAGADFSASAHLFRGAAMSSWAAEAKAELR